MQKTGPGIADVVNQTTSSSSRAVKQRVVWLMFDELDLRLAFLDPPEKMKFPELERFREQALFALNAKSILGGSTAIAIPSYMMGKLVKSAIPIAPDTLKLKFVGNDTGYFGRKTDHQTFLGEARALGTKTAIIGYYHPYSRIFTEDYAFCSCYAVNTYTPQATASVPTEMGSQLRGISPFFRRTNAIATYRGILRDALKVVVDPEYDLIYIHASVPHGPNIYDEHSNTFSVLNVSKHGYFSNLALADHFLGELRRAMEEANLWEQTTILITSDHEWRFPYLYDGKRVRKVPFLLKMQSQNEQLVYETPFYPTLVAKDLLLQVLRGHLNDPKEVINWLTKRKVE
ncbi:MAG: alkaline phosphatase family protein [Candidatus Helarchaeota archaeon]|nr:alkaline phosphatase family protein [Candidatus Helarchaeota archaeon]